MSEHSTSPSSPDAEGQSPAGASPQTGQGAPQLSEEELALLNQMFDLAREGSTDQLRQALEAGVPVNLTNGKALICAVFRGNEAITRRLLEAGAGQDTGFQPARAVAQEFGRENVIPLLDEHA